MEKLPWAFHSTRKPKWHCIVYNSAGCLRTSSSRESIHFDFFIYLLSTLLKAHESSLLQVKNKTWKFVRVHLQFCILVFAFNRLVCLTLSTRHFHTTHWEPWLEELLVWDEVMDSASDRCGTYVYWKGNPVINLLLGMDMKIQIASTTPSQESLIRLFISGKWFLIFYNFVRRVWGRRCSGSRTLFQQQSK